MITSIKDTNADQYSILFSKAVRDLMSHTDEGNFIDTPGSAIPAMEIDTVTFGEENPYEPNEYYRWTGKEFELATEDEAQPGVTYYELKSEYIASLNEYFSYITTLANISPTYTALGLDEPTFDIDLNTREIKVPDVFQKNGVSVEGDEIAEIIYFKVNRYFDMTDLATQEIYIQWRSAATNEDGEYIEGVSTPWCIDYKSQPGYIVFGWPISSKITAKAGQIAFAVRFYKYDEEIDEVNPLIYSLSTLTQTVNVKPALNFDLVDKILKENMPAEGFIDDNNSILIRSRLIDTKVDAGGGEPADAPIFRVNLNPDGQDVVDNIVEGWMDVDNEGFRIVNRDVYVQAYSRDAGKISYVATKLDLDDKDIYRDSFPGGTNDYQVTTDTERQSFKKYYYSKGQGQGYGEIENFENVVWDPESENYVPIYERYYKFTIDSIGKYRVVATNRVNKNSAKTASYKLVVKGPAAIVVSTDIVKTGVLSDLNNNQITLSVVAEAPDSAHSKFAYQWYRKALDFVGAEAEGYEAIEGATDATYIAKQEGYYKVVVYNYLHKDDQGEKCFTYDTSSRSRITNTPKPCSIAVVGKQIKTPKELVSSPFEVSASLPASEIGKHLDSESITYQWYDYETAPEGDYQADINAANECKYEGTEYDTAVPNATQATFIPAAGSSGDFYCRITNHYNGETAVINSPFFTIGG